MANCPKCQAPIADDFGLVTCQSCGAQVFLDFEGAPAGLAPMPEAPLPPHQPVSVRTTLDSTGSVRSGTAGPRSSTSSSNVARTGSGGALDIAGEISQVLVDEFNQEISGVATRGEDLILPPPLPPLEGPAGFLGLDSEPNPRVPASADMGEIADFGNSPLSQGREGLLRFDLHLAGIDTADIRGELALVLKDPKFLWDSDKILAEVKHGRLQLKGLTAVKAALLLQRLRGVAVEIRWEQYAIHHS